MGNWKGWIMGPDKKRFFHQNLPGRKKGLSVATFFTSANGKCYAIISAISCAEIIPVYVFKQFSLAEIILDLSYTYMRFKAFDKIYYILMSQNWFKYDLRKQIYISENWYCVFMAIYTAHLIIRMNEMNCITLGF